MEKVENLVLKNLLYNEEYARKVIPFIKGEYFEDPSNKVLYEEISSFIVKYDELPSKEAVSIEVENREDLTESLFKELSRFFLILKKNLLTLYGYVTPQNDGVVTVLYIWHSWSPSP